MSVWHSATTYVRGIARGDGLKARLIRGGLGTGGIKASNQLLRLAFGIVLARTLGAEGYGVYAYAFAIMTLLMIAAEAGIPTLLMREVAASRSRQDWGELKGAVRRGWQFVGLTGTGVAVLGFLVLWWWADSLEPTVVYTTGVMLVVLPFSALAKTLGHALRGLQRVVAGQAVNELLRPLIALGLIAVVFGLWPEMRRAEYAMTAQLLAAAIAVLMGTVLLRHFMPGQAQMSAPVYRSREWLRSALPFTLLGGAGIINSHADIIMLGWFRTSGEVGLYRVAVQGSVLVAFGLQVANAVVAPQFARLYARGDMQKLQHLVTRSAQLILLSALPVALLFILGGSLILKLVFGEEFVPAEGVLAILAVGQLASAAFGSVGFLLNMTGHEVATARALWITAILNMALNAVLIPYYGMVGAAISTSLALTYWNLALYRKVRSSLGIESTCLRL